MYGGQQRPPQAQGGFQPYGGQPNNMQQGYNNQQRPPQQGGYPPMPGYQQQMPPQQQGGYQQQMPPQQQGGYQQQMPPQQQGGYPQQQMPPQQSPYQQPPQPGMPAYGAGYNNPMQQQQQQPPQGGYAPPIPQQSYYKPLPEPMAYSQQQVYRPPGYVQPPNLKMWFDSVDTNKNGSIQPVELQQALAKGNHPFSLATAEKVVRLFDKDRNGSIGFPEFGEAHLFCENMSNGFRERDVSGNGELDGNEVRLALKTSGYQVNEDSFQVLMLLFDRRKCGALLFDDYVELCIFLHNTRNVYGFYDRQQTGQVTFTFDAFLTAAVTLRSL